MLFQLVYSSKYDVLVDFTRDYDAIRQALYNVEHYDKVCVESMLQAAGSMLLSSWGNQNYNQVSIFAQNKMPIAAHFTLTHLYFDLFIFH